MSHNINPGFGRYLDITPNKMFSMYEYPILGKTVLTLSELHGNQLELKEVVLYDEEASLMAPPDHCWIDE